MKKKESDISPIKKILILHKEKNLILLALIIKKLKVTILRQQVK